MAWSVTNTVVVGLASAAAIPPGPRAIPDEVGDLRLGQAGLLERRRRIVRAAGRWSIDRRAIRVQREGRHAQLAHDLGHEAGGDVHLEQDHVGVRLRAGPALTGVTALAVAPADGHQAKEGRGKQGATGSGACWCVHPVPDAGTGVAVPCPRRVALVGRPRGSADPCLRDKGSVLPWLANAGSSSGSDASSRTAQLTEADYREHPSPDEPCRRWDRRGRSLDRMTSAWTRSTPLLA